mmetsp:Transcript_22390/g.61157  ORF Transcript_22390/g.61157 Transcript_22390/m.61157 type:complete len:208 (-) Transcript_22390:258-881(-)
MDRRRAGSRSTASCRSAAGAPLRRGSSSSARWTRRRSRRRCSGTARRSATSRRPTARASSKRPLLPGAPAAPRRCRRLRPQAWSRSLRPSWCLRLLTAAKRRRRSSQGMTRTRRRTRTSSALHATCHWATGSTMTRRGRSTRSAWRRSCSRSARSRKRPGPARRSSRSRCAMRSLASAGRQPRFPPITRPWRSSVAKKCVMASWRWP